MNYGVLSSIIDGASVKDIKAEKIPDLCNDIRNFLVDNVSKTGGHLASNLGVVELTVALHRVFDSPKDKIVFDVGHQSYVHKILTGRAEMFPALRKKDGLSGFPRPEESVHDAFATGHSSTSVSAALGIATAEKLKGSDAYTVAVIGDGALTGGLSYEGINNAGRSETRLLIVINDNEQSISKNVGAIAKYLSEYTSSQRYFNFKDRLKTRLKKFPVIGNFLFRSARKTKEKFKSLIKRDQGNYFENFGFRYFGPIDGQNEERIEALFKRVKTLGCPAVVHLKTVKGYGYKLAENNPSLYHGVPYFDAESGILSSKKATFSSNFGKTIVKLAEKDGRICAITAAMTDGVGLDKFARQYPTKFFDVGIAEEHGVTFSCGLAIDGMKPVFACYSTFLQRGFDQLVHDSAMQRLPVVYAIDRAGFVGDDGETHQGLFDVSMLKEIPGVTIYSPASYIQQNFAFEEAFSCKTPVCVRYPKGSESARFCAELSFTNDFRTFDCQNADVILVSYGRELYNLFDVKERSDKKVGIVALFKISDIDYSALAKAIGKCKRIHFYEEGMLSGGVAEEFCSHIPCKIHAVEEFVKQGSVSQQYKMCGLDPDSILETING